MFMRTKQYLKALFQAWALTTVLPMAEALRTENARLRMAAGVDKEKSIWSQTKDELVETARRELGLEYHEAKRKTVVVLRQMIKHRRDLQNTIVDPLGVEPKGLEKMLKQQLKEECGVRNLPCESSHFIRGDLIVMIRDDVSRRQIEEGVLLAPPLEPMTHEDAVMENPEGYMVPQQSSSSNSRRRVRDA